MQNEGSTHLHVQHLLRQTPLGILQPLAHHFYLLGGVVEPCLQGGDCRRGEQPSVIPFVNFVTSTMTSTEPVMTSPNELMILERCILRRSAGSVSERRWRFQWRTMPIWLRVNDTKTPMM